jgi:PAS domain S-box-containing protein
MKNHPARPGTPPALDDSAQLLHELHVHQVELQAKNEELRHSHAALEKILEKYKALYEFSPFGYFNLDRRGEITAVNLYGANLLGVDVSRLIGRRFILFIKEEFRSAFDAFLHKVFISQNKELSEAPIQLEGKDKTSFVHIEAQSFQGEECLLALSDISELKEQEISLRRYSERIMVMEEAMRKKFAAELHDEIAQDLTALSLNFTAICNGLPREVRGKLGEKIIISTCLVEEMSRKIRDIMVRLRPPVLDNFGLAAALRWYGELFEKQTGIIVNFQLTEIDPRLHDEIETALFRIIEEALTNIKKHAAAISVNIGLQQDHGRVHLLIQDNGKGFDVKQKKLLDAHSGWGLNLMRERAKAIGAGFSLTSIPGQGTEVFIEIGEKR